MEYDIRWPLIITFALVYPRLRDEIEKIRYPQRSSFVTVATYEFVLAGSFMWLVALFWLCVANS